MAEQAYLATYPSFTPSASTPALTNFKNLARAQNWGKNSKKYKAERDTYLTALADVYISSLDAGGVKERLAELQGLCREVGVETVPDTIRQCRKALLKVNVCIISLIDHQRLGTPIHAFGTLAELKQHIKKTIHYFPKDKAKRQGNGLLALLLRHIVDK